MPEILLTGYGVTANMFFILAFLVVVVSLRSEENKHVAAFAVIPIILGLAFLSVSDKSLNAKHIIDYEFNPLIELDDATSAGHMTIVPYNISVTKQNVREKNRKTYRYNYDVDLYMQRSEIIDLKKNKKDINKFELKGDSYSEANGRHDCITVHYKGRKVELVKKDNYFLDCD